MALIMDILASLFRPNYHKNNQVNVVPEMSINETVVLIVSIDFFRNFAVVRIYLLLLDC